VEAPRLRCRGCGGWTALDDRLVWACPSRGRGDHVDHVLVPVVDRAAVDFPLDGAQNPFVRYRRLLSSYARWRAAGGSDAGFVELVQELDEGVAAIEGTGFGITPLLPTPRVGGGLWVKDETGNVSGSHKGRHLVGIMLHLLVAERLGFDDPGVTAPLAIASCGNAALAAAVVAAAAGRRLEVYVPADASPPVIDRLRALDASITVCDRDQGERGDPCYRRYRQAVDAGAVPFSCQGRDNGLAIEGGCTIGWELAAQLAAAGARAERIVIQVGGGALASAVMRGLADARGLGGTDVRPALHAVQSQGAWPLVRAYRRLRADIDGGVTVAGALAAARAHRDRYMWPWETVPDSAARGILDDETYDWMAVVEALLETGGSALVVGEDQLLDANRLARTATGIDVDVTGSAGLAGFLELARTGVIRPDEQAVVLFTGRRR
jgi:threonine synthase